MKKSKVEILLEEEEEVGGFPNLDKYLEGRERHWVTYTEGARMYRMVSLLLSAMR